MDLEKRSFKLLDVPINPITREDLFAILDFYIKDNAKSKIIGYINLHGLYVSQKDSEMFKFYSQSDLNYIDGMPIVWLGNLFGHKVTVNHRITLLDYVYEVLEFCSHKGYRIAWIGGTEDSISQGMDIIRSKVKNIQLLGINGYKNDDYYLKEINSFKPNLILIGLGMPRQEKWSLRLRDQLETNIIWNIGATIDFISGKVYYPPSWAGRYGLDWLFRFLSEPKRMFFRYFIEPIFLIYFFIMNKLRKS